MAELQVPPSVRDERGKAWEAMLPRFGLIDPAILRMYDIPSAPAAALPALAWGFSLFGELWEAQNTTAKRRAMLQQMFSLQGKRGTSWAVLRAMELLGWPGCQVLTNQDALRHDATANHDGAWYYGTGFFRWYQWALVVPVTGVTYTATIHAQIKRIAQAFARFSSRLLRVDLAVETLTTAGITPAWTGPTALTQIGVSEDGSTWHRRTLLRVTHATGTATLQWRMFGEADVTTPLDINYIGLFNADDSTFATIHRAQPLRFEADMQLFGTWTLTW